MQSPYCFTRRRNCFSFLSSCSQLFHMKGILIVSIFIVLTSFAAMASPVQAALSYHGIQTIINNDLSTVTNVTLRFSSPETSLQYTTNIPVSSLKTGGSFGPVACGVARSGTGSIISCSFSGITPDKNTLYLNIISNGAVNYSYGRYHCNMGYAVSLKAEQVFSLIQLPASATLADSQPNRSYDPSDSTTITDGQNIMVIWDGGNVTAGQRLDFRAEYNLPPITGPVTRYILIGAGASVLIVIAVALIYIRRASRFSKGRVIESVLNSDENRVVEIIAAAGSGALQKHIVRESGFSKAKVSRLVKSLGGRGVVRVEPVSGRENRVLLAAGKKEEKENKEQATANEGDGNEGDGNESEDDKNKT